MARTISVLVSAGQNPITERGRRASLDAKALELALRLCAAHPEYRCVALHAGQGGGALREYLGMGLAELTVLRISARQDPATALASHLRGTGSDLVLAGAQAVDGFGAGMLPYRVARLLNLPILPEIASIKSSSQGFLAEQAHEFGARRVCIIDQPTMVTVAAAAPAPRGVSFYHARRGRLIEVPASAQEEALEHEAAWALTRARTIRRRIKSVDPNASAEERFRAITQAGLDTQRAALKLSPEEAAAIILREIEDAGLLRVQKDEGNVSYDDKAV